MPFGMASESGAAKGFVKMLLIFSWKRKV